MVSVVVCTIERPEQLDQCLRSILASDYPAFEVVVADQSHDDRNSRVVSRLADARVRLVRLDRAGKTRAANSAVALARGDILAFTDDDCMVPQTWLRRAGALLAERPDEGLIFGAVVAGPSDPRGVYVTTFEPTSFRRFTSTHERSSVHGMGCNLVIRREVVNRIGGFDECLGPGARFPCAEDTDYAYCALCHGITVAHDPTNAVVHDAHRLYANGEARRLVMTYAHGLGVCYARHAFSGDWHAGLFLVRELAMVIHEVIWNAVRLRRPFGVRRALSWFVGVVDAVGSPLRSFPT
jgi:glycosyltransferase involved in cell wall biosynthesis